MGRSLPVEVRKQNFIDLAKSIHGDKYSYDRVVYVKNNEYVTITCKIHGDFTMKPMVHTGSKSGCKKCFSERRHLIRAKGVDFYVNLAKQIHGDRYDYSKVKFNSCREKSEIVCKEHGSFHQTMDNHTHGGKGCPQCGSRSAGDKQSLSKQDWLERFKSIHGDEFSYPNDFDTTNHNCYIDVVCRVHGKFKQSLASHARGTKCPECQRAFMGGFYRKGTTANEVNNLYLISFSYNGRLIYKVGVTKDFYKRFKLLNSEIGVDPVLLYSHKDTTSRCLEVERRIKSDFKYSRALFDVKFGGYTECYDLTDKQAVEIQNKIIAYFN